MTNQWTQEDGADPDTAEISDVQIDSTTEAFATVQMPAEIGPKSTCNSQVQG